MSKKAPSNQIKPKPPVRVVIVISQKRLSRHQIDMPSVTPAQLETLYAAIRKMDAQAKEKA